MQAVIACDLNELCPTSTSGMSMHLHPPYVRNTLISHTLIPRLRDDDVQESIRLA